MDNLVVDNLDILMSREWLVVSSKNISIIDYMLIFTLLFAYTRSQALDQLLHNHFFITGVRWQKHISKKIQKKRLRPLLLKVQDIYSQTDILLAKV
jgi:hypothetical protein